MVYIGSPVFDWWEAKVDPFPSTEAMGLTTLFTLPREHVIYPFFFLPLVYRSNRWTDFRGSWLKRRGLAQVSAFVSRIDQNSYFGGQIPQKHL